jgi:hypothetical protein
MLSRSARAATVCQLVRLGREALGALLFIEPVSIGPEGAGPAPLMAEVFVGSTSAGHEPPDAPGHGTRRRSTWKPRSSYSSVCASRRCLGA